MHARGLIDTGAILAILNPRDRWHERCVEAFELVRLPLATTAAVLAELFHLLGDHPQDVAAAWRFLRSGAVTVLPITDADLPDLDQLMKRYADRPMDFADATLVHIAKRASLTTICTIDHNDFETLLDFVGEEGAEVSARQHVLGGRSLMDLNTRLVHPHAFSFKRPRQQSFPRVHALYLLLRAMGMAYVERRGSKHVLVPDAAVTASWDQLTLTEQYFNLFAAWMTRLGEQAILGDRVDPVRPLYRCLKFIEEIPDEGCALTSREEMEDFRYYPGFHHLALMDLFGFVTLEEADSEDGWEIRRIGRRPFGEALIHPGGRGP